MPTVLRMLKLYISKKKTFDQRKIELCFGVTVVNWCADWLTDWLTVRQLTSAAAAGSNEIRAAKVTHMHTLKWPSLIIYPFHSILRGAVAFTLFIIRKRRRIRFYTHQCPSIPHLRSICHYFSKFSNVTSEFYAGQSSRAPTRATEKILYLSGWKKKKKFS